MSHELPTQEEFEKIDKYEAEVERIQKKLEEFLSKEDASKIAGRVYDMALDIDGSLDKLLTNREVLAKYDYNGEFFEPKDGKGWHKALNGLNFLKKAVSDDNVESFFRRTGGVKRAIGSMLWWLRDFVWLVKARRLNWEETGDIGLVSKKVLNEILEDYKLRANEEMPPPISSGEKTFFRLYEEEMNLPDGKLDDWLKRKREEQK